MSLDGSVHSTCRLSDVLILTLKSNTPVGGADSEKFNEF